MIILLCPNCNFQNPPGMRFCGNCGSRLPEAPDETETSTSPTEPSSEHFGVMMGADLIDRLRQAGYEAAGQRRNVTVLFVDVVGYTSLSERIDPEDLYTMMQDFIRLLVNNVYKYEGIVDKLTGDGLMALFGAPIAHENNAERAVRASLDMQTDVAQLSIELKHKLGIELQVRIGLNSGEVIVGGLGSNLMMNYTAIGDTVNLSRRIEEAADPGTVMVSESVYRQTKALFHYVALPPLELKGVSHLTPVFRTSGLREKPGSVRGVEGLHAPMIGRESELVQLKRMLASLLEQKRGHFAIITGEGGLGKSRLTSEFRASIPAGQIRILEGQSQAYRRSLSYWVFQDVLYSFLGMTPGVAPARVNERLEQTLAVSLGPQAADALPYIQAFLSLPLSQANAERLQYLNAGQLRQQTFLALRTLLIQESFRQPLVIILEDLHWADQASLELLLYLEEILRQAPIFILGISRQVTVGEMTTAVEWAQQNLGERYKLLPLKYLSENESNELLLHLLGTTDIPPRLRRDVLQRASGIPFYLEEILRMLIDQGVIRRTEDRWVTTEDADLETLGVPDTLQGMVLARFDRLDSFQRHVLQAASVIGKDFRLPILNEVIGIANAEKLLIAINTLLEREFVQPKPSQTDDLYTFRHILMSDAIYHTMLKDERSHLHGQVAAAIEGLYADRLDEFVDLLARHYSWSHHLDRALHYIILAGQKSLRTYNNSQARQYFEDALALFPKVDHALKNEVDVHTGLGDVLLLIGEYAQARNHYQSALEIIAEKPTADFLCEKPGLQRKIATTFERQGEYQEAIYYLDNAQHSLENLDKAMPVEDALILNDTGWIHYRRGNTEQALKYFFEALEKLENTTQYDVTSSIYNRIGGVFYQTGQLDQASTYVRRSLVQRQEIGDTVAVARSYNNLGLLEWKKGDWDNALESFRHSMELHADLGDVEGSIEVQSNLGLLQLCRGDTGEALQYMKNALDTAEQIGHQFHIGIIYLYFCRLFVSMEEWQSAIGYGNKSLQILSEIGAMDDLINVYTYLGIANLGMRNLEQASEWVIKALDLSNQLANGRSTTPDEKKGLIYRLKGEIALEKGDLDEAEKWLRQSKQLFEALNNQFEQTRSSVSLARLAIKRRQFANARLLLSEARLIFRQLGAAQELNHVDALSSLHG